MSTIRKAALEILRSSDFFAQLRSAMAQIGLAGEEKFGMVIFFAMTSRFRPNPLRLALLESTEGSAEYMVRCVSRLFERGTITGVDPEDRWKRFSANPKHRVVYVRKWSDRSREDLRFEIHGNELSRIAREKRNGRIIETPETIEASFVCIAEDYPWNSNDRSRWLTMELPLPPVSAPNQPVTLSDEELETWKEVQRLVGERAKRTVVLPEWSDALVEQTCEDERRPRHVPYFLRAWEMMSLLRSFVRDEFSDNGDTQNFIQANFEDLAVTSLLLRGVSKEGHWFPSPKSVFIDVFPVGEEKCVLNPFTGKGVRYSKKDKRPAQSKFVSLGL